MKKTLLLIIASIFICIASSAQSEGFVKHTVKWYEDIATISKKYGVPVDVIVKINNLAQPQVKNRQVILIPTSEEYWPGAQVEEEIQEEEEMPSKYTTVPNPVGHINLGVYLPFNVGSESQRGNVADFYSGVLMAVKEAAGQGLDIRLMAEDMNNLFNTENCDLIIGPFRSNDFETVAANITGIPLVSPLDQKTAALADNNPNIVQGAASASDQLECILEWEEGTNYIVIGCEQDSVLLKDAIALLDAHGIAYKLCMCQVQGEIEGWEEAYSEEDVNKVIIAINNEAILNNAIRNMCIEESKGNVISYAGSKAASYESIPTENIHRANLHVLNSYFIDYTDQATLDFLHAYRALYNSEPNQYAFQGHDIALFLIRTYAKYGKSWEALISNEPQIDMLQTSFKFKRLKNGGLVNVAARKVVYTKEYKTILSR